ncbi:glycoside hydrolase family 88 protein [Marasmius fiardii PR-910]|nr:glycoside hydrolase family 88 protein [Marasmius fiardii PR-910]
MAKPCFTKLQVFYHGLLVFVTSLYRDVQNVPPAELYSPLIPQKVLRSYSSLPSPIQYPQWTDQSVGKWDYFVPDTWTSGFFPATLYEMHNRQNLCPENSDAAGPGRDWLDLGRKACDGLVGLPGHNTQGHDVGFLSFAFLEELKINPNNQTAINVVNGFATDLANRFVPGAGVTRSWDSDSDPSRVRVIIDNMMNLELLFVSADLTGNKTLREIAMKHADTTMNNHIRPDGSTWHVVEYDVISGRAVSKHTAQGYSDDSVWARGQAWGIYGFSQMYERTSQERYLATARRLANYFLSNIPEDGIVPWDFKAPLRDPKVPGGVRPADSSAATAGATALLLLASLESDDFQAERWTWGAIRILQKITELAWNPSWESLLSNGTVNWPMNSFLTGIVYGDHYFIKAGNELLRMGLTTC